MPTRRQLLALPLLLLARPALAQDRVQLMMVTARHCAYCAAWKREIGPGYAASPAGRAAPIFEVDLDGPYPDGLALDRRPWITPSFILLRNGVELGRIEGYVGQRYFYPVLDDLLRKAGL
jgi:hypothetical protein